jgi:Kef-type K+ transport system membrane component KefB
MSAKEAIIIIIFFFLSLGIVTELIRLIPHFDVIIIIIIIIIIWISYFSAFSWEIFTYPGIYYYYYYYYYYTAWKTKF